MYWDKKIIKFLKRDNKKVVFLINVKNKLDEVALFFNNHCHCVPTSCQIIVFNTEIPRQFLQTKFNIKSSEDYLVRQDYETIDRFVFGGLSKNWYAYRNITKYRGVHLGKLFEYDFQKYLTPRIKNLEVLKRIVSQDVIEKIVAIEDTGELCEVARLYAAVMSIPILEIELISKKGLFASLKSVFKAGLSKFLSTALDCFAFRKIMKDRDGKDFILIDAKLNKYFKGDKEKIAFLQCPVEKGLAIRFRLMKEASFYLPLHFQRNASDKKDWGRYKKIWRGLSNDENFKHTFEYNGISIWKIVKQGLAIFFLKGVPRAISNINMLDKVAKVKKIKLVVLRNDVKELERTLILGLRQAEIPSLVIQHGILAETNGHNVLLADKFAVWGKAALDWYKSFGNSADKFVITGNISFDRFVNWKPHISKEELCRQLNLDQNKEIILFVTQQINKFSSFWTDDLFLLMAEELLDAMQQFPDKQLIIKADPYEDIEPYEKKIKEGCYKNSTVVKNIDIYNLIFWSDLVITLDSTAGIEAMIFDKPLITFNVTKREDRVPYAKKGAAVGLYRKEELLPAIKSILSDEDLIFKLKSARKKFIEEYAYRVDGNSGNRVFDLVEDLMEAK